MRSKYTLVEQRYEKPMAQILKDLFEKFGSREAVASELGVSTSTISWWLTRCGLRQVTRLERVEGVGQ